MVSVILLSLDASKLTRNGFVHPYVPHSSYLIAIGAPNCDHASELIDSARNNPDKSEQLEIKGLLLHTQSCV